MTIAYDLAGPDSAPAVVLVHSAICDRTMWDPQWPLLIEHGYRVLRCDLRGYGQTPVATEPYNNAEDLRDLLNSVGAEQVSILGSSFGGEVGQEFAARWPRRTAKLVLLGSGTQRQFAPTPAAIAFARRQAELIQAGDVYEQIELNIATYLGPAADEATRERVRRMYRNTLDRRRATANMIEPTRPEIDLGAIITPTLVVTGAHDIDYFQQIARLLAATIPNARLLTLGWAGHLPSLEDPNQLNPVLLEFLDPN